mgnify:CR=1 FL=1
MIGFLIALLSGALMSIQGVFNTQVTKTTGMWVGNGWVQFTAFAVCLAMWFFTGRDQVSQLMEVQPKYMLLGGVIGAGITWTVIKSIEALGPARCLSDPAFRIVWNGSGAVLMEKSRWSPSCGCRHSSFSMEIKVINL